MNRIKPGGFAEGCAEIASGDVIESVGGKSCMGVAQSDLGDLILGPEGTIVALALAKPDGRKARARPALLLP